ncbi:MAG TPA: winged helix-turn-helix domain-containing protein, partial [Solirubrobacterales bacterium]|nr:winged helix-turn-helix domain-containing protein [Solirubrobacterales bacterium]
STVSYWLKKHGLEAEGKARHAPKAVLDPIRLRELVDSGATIREIADRFGVGYSSVRHWLKKLGLRTAYSERVDEFEEARKAGRRKAYGRCPKHGHTAFFQRPDGGFRCARCNSDAVAARRRKVKQLLVEEAGGACIICGYDGYQGALQFHHLDPSQKAFIVSRQGVTRSLDSARAEAAKCVLLCANCHAEVEAGLADVPLE